MNLDTFHIRPGTAWDLAAAHDLVRELAAYEREPEAVTATIADYQEDLERGWFELLVAEYQGEVIGIAIAHRAYSTWKGRMFYLDDLVIREAWRRKGVGQLLFAAVMDLARQRGARLLKWQVLDWNEPALAFYRQLQARIETTWLNGKIEL